MPPDGWTANVHPQRPEFRASLHPITARAAVLRRFVSSRLVLFRSPVDVPVAVEALSMRLWPRMIATVVVATVSLGTVGCASVQRVFAPKPVCDNPLIVPSADFETVWRETAHVLDEYFEIRSENRLSRTIVTDPVQGATLLEPWRGDSADLYGRFESSLQTIRRFARVQIDPVPGRGYSVKVEVLKELEDLARPDRQAAGRAVFNNDFPINRTHEIVGPVPVPNQWIPRGRDTRLEQVILNRIRDGLFL